MSVSPKRLERILDVLREQCIRGYLHLRISNRIDRAIREMTEKLKPYRLYFEMSRNAHDEMALLYLSRLLDNNPEAAGIPYLLRVARSNPRLFRHISKPDLLEAIDRDEAVLSGDLADVLQILKNHRDRYVAHVDRRELEAGPGSEPAISLTRKHVEGLYMASIEILNRYHLFYNNETWKMDEVVGEEQVERLLDVIGAG